MDQMTNQWNSYMKSTLEAGKAFENFNLKLIDQLTRKQVEFFTSTVDASSKWVSSFGEYKSLPELLTAQSKLAGELSARLIAMTRETTDLLSASREEFKALFDKGFQAFTVAEETAAKPVVAPRKAA